MQVGILSISTMIKSLKVILEEKTFHEIFFKNPDWKFPPS